MPKPTLIQSLLGRPSKSYRFPEQKDYYINRSSLLLHAAAAVSEPSLQGASDNQDPHSLFSTHKFSPPPVPEEQSVHSDDDPSDEEDEQGEQESPDGADEQPETEDDSDTFYTANSSPRSSIMSTTSTTSLSSTMATTSVLSSGVTDPTTYDFYTPLPAPAPRKRSKREHSRSVGSSASGSTSGSHKYSDEDWAREVRWLVAPGSGGAAPPKPKRAYTISEASSSRSSRRTLSESSGSHHRKSKTPPTMMSMTAVLEEDEGPAAPGAGLGASSSSTTLHSYQHPHKYQRLRTTTGIASLDSQGGVGSIDRLAIPRPKTPTSVSYASGSSRRSTTSNSRPALPRRRSRSLEDKPTHQRHATAPGSTTTTSEGTAYTSTTSAYLPSQGTPGYTSLTLPRAPPPSRPLPNNRRSILLGSSNDVPVLGKVDLTLGGLAQTTMATVEVVKGLSEKSAEGRTWFGTKRRKSKKKGKRRDGMYPSESLGFTSHRKPPESVGGSDVLVQVWAVGLDDFDRRLLCPPIAGDSTTSVPEPNVGWIPGRSVVGRVVEAGWDVRDEVCKRGEWVVGLLDVRQSGALAEFILIDRHRVTRVPHPALTPSSTKFTLEELALIPLCGVPAYRVARTFLSAFPRSDADDTLPPSRSKSKTIAVPKNPRILILRGEEGTGSMVGQILIKCGWRVVVHCRLPSTDDSSTPGSSPDSSQERIGGSRSTESGHSSGTTRTAPTSESTQSARSAHVDPREIEERVKGWGAESVVFGDEMEVLGRLTSAGEPFDGLFDTVGGKDLYEAGERLLLAPPPPPPHLENPSGSPAKRQKTTISLFVTTVGDTPSRVIPTNKDNFLSSLRSWGRGGSASGVISSSGGSSGSKKVGFAWVSVAQDVDWEGNDVGDTLGIIVAPFLRRGDEGGLGGVMGRPYVGAGAGRVVSLDKAAGAFDGYGTVVVKVV